jgi:lipoyl synthase
LPSIPKKKPAWLKTRIPQGARYRRVKSALDACGIHTVCQEAHCPNVGECWEAGTATFMILGDICTRGCQFCAVGRGDPGGGFEDDEPNRVARVIEKMGLDYAVITSVTRDDLSDGGAAIFAQTVRSCKALKKPPLVELLIPDYLDENLGTVLKSKPDVLAHNIEVVERLSSVLRHKRFSYERSLRTLEQARLTGSSIVTKSSIMLGLGESDAEIEASMLDLRSVGVDILVLGQYLRPTREHVDVVEYVSPKRFAQLEIRGEELGFGFVAAGPLVRTSYKAAEAFTRHILS